jgi:hypothetical protein
MNSDIQIPSLRVPCLVNGQCTFQSPANLAWRIPRLIHGRFHYLPLLESQARPFVLCCVPSLLQTEAWLLDPQVSRFAECGTLLAVLVYTDFVLGQAWVRPPHEFDVPLMADPLGRLTRKLRLSRSLAPGQCETCVFSRHHCLQFRLFHDLTLHGIATVLDVLERDSGPIPDQNFTDSASNFVPAYPPYSGTIIPKEPYTCASLPVSGKFLFGFPPEDHTEIVKSCAEC